MSMLLLGTGSSVAVSWAWQASLDDAADEQLVQQAGLVTEELDEQVGKIRALHESLVGLSTATPRFDVARFESGLADLEVLAENPGALTLGYLEADPGADAGVRLVHEHNVFETGDIELGLRRFLDASMRDTLERARATGELTASPTFMLDVGAGIEPQPMFVLVAPVADRDAWVFSVLYGNWFLRSAITSAGSSLRAEVRDAGDLVAGDWIPMGPDSTSNAPIPTSARAVTSDAPWFGRPWTLTIADADGSTAATAGDGPRLIVAAGVVLGLFKPTPPAEPADPPQLTTSSPGGLRPADTTRAAAVHGPRPAP